MSRLDRSAAAPASATTGGCWRHHHCHSRSREQEVSTILSLTSLNTTKKDLQRCVTRGIAINRDGLLQTISELHAIERLSQLIGPTAENFQGARSQHSSTTWVKQAFCMPSYALIVVSPVVDSDSRPSDTLKFIGDTIDGSANRSVPTVGAAGRTS
jgi:hypothetical protein